jgi:hypothetical protein
MSARRGTLIGAVGAAAVVLIAVVLALSLGGGEDDPAGAGARTATATTTPGAPAPAPTVAPLPVRVPGYVVSRIGIRSYRISLVFRLRNTILNGVEGPASDYSIQSSNARRAGRTALLFGVGAAAGASPPDIPADIVRLIGVPARVRERVRGLPVSVFVVPEYSLAVVDAGPRRAVVAIGVHRAEALALARAVARAIADE